MRGYLSLSKEEPAVQQRRPTARTLAGRTGTPHRRRRSRRRSRREVSYPTTAKLKRREEKCRCGRRRGGDPPSPPVGERRSGARAARGRRAGYRASGPERSEAARVSPRRGCSSGEARNPAGYPTPKRPCGEVGSHSIPTAARGAAQAPPAGASPAAREGSHRRRCAPKRHGTMTPSRSSDTREAQATAHLSLGLGARRGARRGGAGRGRGLGRAGQRRSPEVAPRRQRGLVVPLHGAPAPSRCRRSRAPRTPSCGCTRLRDRPTAQLYREVVVTSRHARSRRAQCFSTCGNDSRWTKRDAPSSGTHAPEGRAAGRVRRISPQHEGREGDEGDAIATRSRSGARLGRTRVSESRTSRRPHAACTHVMCTHNLPVRHQTAAHDSSAALKRHHRAPRRRRRLARRHPARGGAAASASRRRRRRCGGAVHIRGRGLFDRGCTTPLGISWRGASSATFRRRCTAPGAATTAACNSRCRARTSPQPCSRGQPPPVRTLQHHACGVIECCRLAAARPARRRTRGCGGSPSSARAARTRSSRRSRTRARTCRLEALWVAPDEPDLDNTLNMLSTLSLPNLGMATPRRWARAAPLVRARLNSGVVVTLGGNAPSGVLGHASAAIELAEQIERGRRRRDRRHLSGGGS